jgi:hypothetical protein
MYKVYIFQLEKYVKEEKFKGNFFTYLAFLDLKKKPMIQVPIFNILTKLSYYIT